jgi:hypothetical protein
MGKTRVVHVKKERYDIYIGRPSIFGNPFKIGQDGNREEVIEKYRQWISGSAFQDIEPIRRKSIVNCIRFLKGRILGCWCKPRACHGDVLAEMAESDGDKSLRS